MITKKNSLKAVAPDVIKSDHVRNHSAAWSWSKVKCDKPTNTGTKTHLTNVQPLESRDSPHTLPSKKDLAEVRRSSRRKKLKETLRTTKRYSVTEFVNELIFEARALWADPTIITKPAEEVQGQAYWDNRRRTVNFRFLPKEIICFGRREEIEVYLNSREDEELTESIELVEEDGEEGYLSFIDSADDLEYSRRSPGKRRKVRYSILRHKSSQAVLWCKRKVKHKRLVAYRKLIGSAC